MEEVRKPSSASEALAAFRAQERQYLSSSGVQYTLRKPTASTMLAAGFFTLPSLGGNLEGEDGSPQADAEGTAKKIIMSPEGRRRLVTTLLLACVVSPALTPQGTASNEEKNTLSLDDVPAGEQVELMHAILNLAGFSGELSEFFRGGAEGGLAGSGCPGETVREATA